MNQLIRPTLRGVVLSGADTVRVIARARAFRNERIMRDIPAGLTVAELLEEVLGADADRPLAVGLSDDNGAVGLPREVWGRVRPKPGTVLTVRPALQKGALKIALQLALVVAAIAATVFLPGLGLGFTTFTASLVSAGVVMGGSLALNALFPVRPQPAATDGQAFQQLASIAGGQNQATPYGAVPVLLGRHRMSPLYGAVPFTELIGDDQYLHLLFVWGVGPIDIDQSTFKIGETPLSSFADVTVEHRGGYSDDPAISLYTTDADEQQLSVLLSNPHQAGAQTAEDDWVVRTTAPDADVFSFDVTAPDGVYVISEKDGSIGVWQVVVEWRYRLVGTSVWTYGNPDYPVFSRSTGTQRLARRVTPPARGQYEVALRKATTDAEIITSSGRIKDRVIWTALRSFTNEPPITSPVPLCITAVRIRATDQLNGNVATFNGIGTSVVTAHDGAAWVTNTASNHPADLFRHALQGRANARPRTDSEIDLDNLAAWKAATPDFAFNQYRLNPGSVYDALADIAAAGRAVPTFIDGKWGVIWDRPDDAIVQHFTPRNSWGFKGSRLYAVLPHAYRIPFINEDNGYTQDERIVYDDGYDENNATLFEQQQFPGVTDPELIYKHGRFHIAQTRLRPETFVLSTGWENLVCTRGDRVRVTHDVVLLGQISGRVISISGQNITVDEAITLENGKTYAFTFRNADTANRSVTRAVDAVMTSGEYAPGDTITLVGDLAVIDADALFGFGETDAESAIYRVKSIRHQKDLVAELTLVDDAAGIALADQGDVPGFDPHISLPVDPFTLPPQHLQYVEYVTGFGANATVSVRLSWTLPRKGKVAAFEVQNRDDNGDGLWRTIGTVAFPGTSFDIPLIASGLWSYRVRCLFEDGTASDWSTLPTLNLLGLLTPPDEVANFRSSYDQTSGRIYLTWDVIDDNRGVLYEIRKGASWDAALIVGEAIAQPKFQTVGDDTYWIAGYVVTPFGLKIFSETKHSLELTGSVLTENVVVSRDEKAGGWDGYFGGTVGRDDDLGYIRTSGEDSILDEADFLGLASVLNNGVQDGGYFRSKTIVDAGREMPCRVSVDYSATGVPVTADFLGDPDLLNNPDFLQSYLTQYIRVYPVIRVGTADDPDVFTPSDVFAEDDVFAAGITWGDWQKWSPDVYVGRFFQLGLIFEILDTSVGAIAYALSFSWVVDVADRLDRYQNLTVPVGGLTIAFTPAGSDNATPFKGGINNETLPHILTDYVDRPTGRTVRVTELSVSSCKVTVFDSGGVDVGGTGINVMAQGYG